MSRSKQKKFDEVANNPHVLEEGKELFEKVKGKWRELVFKNDNPIVVEFGCGKGEYTVALGRKYPNKNFIGVDIKGSRIVYGSRIAREEKLSNVAFLRKIIQNVDEYFDHNEVDEIWITFPDPRPRDRDEKKRLTSIRFFDIYKKFLKPNAVVNFKTDNDDLFNYTLEEVIPQLDTQNLVFTKDLYNSDLLNEHTEIKTHYEQIYLDKGQNINYMQFVKKS